MEMKLFCSSVIIDVFLSNFYAELTFLGNQDVSIIKLCTTMCIY